MFVLIKKGVGLRKHREDMLNLYLLCQTQLFAKDTMGNKTVSLSSEFGVHREQTLNTQLSNHLHPIVISSMREN